jgi:uncharacterized protein YecE (DUF72 family)
VLLLLPEILLGTSGWSYAEWERVLYFSKQSKLKQYSSIFPTVEINSTFYSLPKNEFVYSWIKQTPQDFTFASKLPQIITHKKIIDASKDIETDLNKFLKTLEPLIEANKLECILVQLPPFLKFDEIKLESFLAQLPNHLNFSIEFRHLSWLKDDTFKLLERYQVTYTIVDEPLLPLEVHVTSDLAYFRFHGRGNRPWFNYKYSEEELKEITPKIKEAAGKADKVLGYFNNHFHAYAPENCLQTMQMLGTPTLIGPTILRRISFQRNEIESKVVATLDSWTGPIKGDIFEDKLMDFAEQSVIEKAKTIPDTEFSLRQDNKRDLAAYLGDTSVDINFEEQRIIHYCPIWTKTSIKKKFCPHIVKFMMSIDKNRAIEILSKINSSMEKWHFESKLAVEFPN